MRLRLPLALFLAALLTLAAALPASAATRRPDLRPAAVRGVPTVAQLVGGQFIQRARIRNRGRAAARSSVIGLFLSTNRRRDRGDTRLGTARTGVIRRRRAVRRRIRARIPVTIAPGVYRLI